MVTPEPPPYSPSEKWTIIEEGDLPELGNRQGVHQVAQDPQQDRRADRPRQRRGHMEVGKLHKYISSGGETPIILCGLLDVS